MKFECKEIISLEEGRHEGVISRIDYRTEPFEYTDVYIKVDGHDFELKYGAPSSISVNTKLGKLISLFTDLKPGKDYDPEKLLVGKTISFLVTTEETPKGAFSKIVEGSIKSLE